jgi:septum site-determining protein MinC
MTEDAIMIKGTKEGLLINLKGQISFPRLKRELTQRLTAGDAFLVGAHVTIDLGQNYLTDDQLDLLAEILADNGLIIRKISRGSADDPRVFFFDFGSNGFQDGQEGMWVKETTEEQKTVADLDNNLLSENTILLQRTLRSGQSLKYPGNVVILGDVNPGGEVIAGGNIIVMGCLRGVAHAGALGDENAIVTAFRLQPTQLRIANHITRAPDGKMPDPQYPEIAKIKSGMIVIEIYHSHVDRPVRNAVGKN